MISPDLAETVKRLRDKFEARISPEPNSGCWLWVGGLDRAGYGQFHVGLKSDCSGFMASEVAGELSQRGLNMGAIYFEIAPGEWVYSLRSSNDFDVSAVAKQFGGGGHKGAAGFKTAKLIHEAA